MCSTFPQNNFEFNDNNHFSDEGLIMGDPQKILLAQILTKKVESKIHEHRL